MKFRRTHYPTASGIVTISIETMTSKTTIKKWIDCKIQMKVGWFWITIKNYSIGMEYDPPIQSPVKINYYR